MELLTYTALDDIEGFDAKAGLARAGGNIPDYYEILRVYIKDLRKRAPFLAAVPTDGADLRRWTTEAHAVKGASASVGATALAKEAACVEALGRANDRTALTTLAPLFAEALLKLAAALESALDKTRTKARPASGLDESAPLLKKLATALAAEDIGVIDSLLEKLRGIPLTGQERARVEAASDAVLVSDFEGALAALR
jgi:HPt (histidine-containing phosphotransfer) domain-containing protein